jgi:MYXO-CTERM domain-containing protein
VQRGLVFLAMLATMVVAAGDAGAFCRTTTEPLPAGFDPTVDGCWTKGAPIAWLWDQHVGYSLAAAASRQVDLTDATTAADRAFARWNNVDCNGRAPNVTAFDAGSISSKTVAAQCTTTPCDPTAGGYHLVVFRDDGWDYDDPANTLALTTVTYAVDSAVLFDAEIEINTHDHTLSTAVPTPAGAFDLESVLTHEAGHFLGLAHATSEASVMYAYYSADTRELTQDDIAGICAMYPPQAGSSGMSCSVGAARSGGGPFAALVAGLLALVWARRRR